MKKSRLDKCGLVGRVPLDPSTTANTLTVIDTTLALDHFPRCAYTGVEARVPKTCCQCSHPYQKSVPRLQLSEAAQGMHS